MAQRETGLKSENVRVGTVRINVFQLEVVMFADLYQVLPRAVTLHQHLPYVMQTLQQLEYKTRHLEKLHNALLVRNQVGQ